MIASDLNRKVSIMAPPAGVDSDYGTPSGAWTTFADHIWCNVQDVAPSKSEAVRNGMRIAAQATRFRIRARPGITSDMRVVLHGSPDRTFSIVSPPAEVENRRLLEFVGEEYSTVGA